MFVNTRLENAVIVLSMGLWEAFSQSIFIAYDNQDNHSCIGKCIIAERIDTNAEYKSVISKLRANPTFGLMGFQNKLYNGNELELISKSEKGISLKNNSFTYNIYFRYDQYTPEYNPFKKKDRLKVLLIS